jgi:transposase
MKIETVGLDLAKTLFQVHGVDSQGHIVVRKQLCRADVLAFFAKLEPCVVGMEVCGSSHYWGRELTKLGHTVRLIAPQFVRPYVKSNKTDAADAEAICEAVRRPHMRFVPIKTQAQRAMLSLHRARAGLVKSRTALANQIRGLLSEFGHDERSSAVEVTTSPLWHMPTPKRGSRPSHQSQLVDAVGTKPLRRAS